MPDDSEVLGTDRSQPLLSGMAPAPVEGTRLRIPALVRGYLQPGDELKCGVMDISSTPARDQDGEQEERTSRECIALFPVASYERLVGRKKRELQEASGDDQDLRLTLNYLYLEFIDASIGQGWRIELGRLLRDWEGHEEEEFFLVGWGDHLRLMGAALATEVREEALASRRVASEIVFG